MTKIAHLKFSRQSFFILPVVFVVVLAVAYLPYADVSENSVSVAEEYKVEEFIPGEYIVKLRDLSDIQGSRLTNFNSSLGSLLSGVTDVVTTPIVGNFVLVQSSSLAATVTQSAAINAEKETPGMLATRQIIEAISSNPLVVYAEPNYIYKADLVPNDPLFSSLWGISSESNPEGDIDGTTAYDLVADVSNEVIVAVIDTGVDYTHPDLANIVLRDATGKVVGKDFVNNDDDPMDDQGHGTHVAGTIAAEVNNGIGVAGVCSKCKIMPLKFLNATGAGSSVNAIKALRYVIDNNVKVVNNSWGSPGSSRALAEIIKEAYDKGIMVFSSAGNSGSGLRNYPAATDYSFSVAASSTNGMRSSFSTYGYDIDLAAPGGEYPNPYPPETFADCGSEVLSTYLTGKVSSSLPVCTQEISGGNYSHAVGTSMAAPHATGAGAMILAKYPDLTPSQIFGILLQSTDPVTSDQFIGVGKLNLASALLKEVKHDTNSVELLDAYVTFGQSGRVFNLNLNQEYSLYIKLKNHYGVLDGVKAIVTGDSACLANQIEIPLPNMMDWDIKELPNVGVIKLEESCGQRDSFTYKIQVVNSEQDVLGEKQFRVRVNMAAPNWPVPNAFAYSAWDSDSDGRDEILYMLDETLHLVGYDNKDKAGWPLQISKAGTSLYSSSHVVGNFDADPAAELFLDIAFLDYGREVWIVEANGTISKKMTLTSSSEYLRQGRMMSCDISGDGIDEVVGDSYSEAFYIAQIWSGTVQKTYFVPHLSSATDNYGQGVEFVCGKRSDLKPGKKLYTLSGAAVSTAVATSASLEKLRVKYELLRDLRGDLGVENIYNSSLLPGFGVADMDRDGQEELLFSMGSKFCLTCSPANPTEQFKIFALDSTGKLLPGWPQPGSTIAIGDINNDGLLDIVSRFSRFEYNRILAYKLDGSVIWDTSAPTVTPRRAVGRLALVDIDGDKSLEIMDFDSAGKLYLYDNTGNFIAEPKLMYDYEDSEYAYLYDDSVSIADFSVLDTNGDGKLEILMQWYTYFGQSGEGVQELYLTPVELQFGNFRQNHPVRMPEVNYSRGNSYSDYLPQGDLYFKASGSAINFDARNYQVDVNFVITSPDDVFTSQVVIETSLVNKGGAILNPFYSRILRPPSGSDKCSYANIAKGKVTCTYKNLKPGERVEHQFTFGANLRAGYRAPFLISASSRIVSHTIEDIVPGNNTVNFNITTATPVSR
ncbi:MAG: S8 family serine peptidase [Candidatus Doudnabacteria bacterium]|nr:S8 family serine peptidase [Candidatus Doudnabacteria bacterium]